MSDSTFLYLQTRGRKSGQPRRIEIWFVERAGRYYLVSEQRERSNWVQNLQAEPAVQLSVGTRADEGSELPRTAGRARVLDAEGADAELAGHVRALMDAKYRWSDGLIVELTPQA
jgi:deazaflavin-dependent oxidoreductase (nitroreductase family)